MDELLTPLVRRSFFICDEVLRKASLRATELDKVFLVGGAVLYPAVVQTVQGYFGDACQRPSNPVTAVAGGASLLAQQALG